MRILLVHSGFEISTAAVGDGLARAFKMFGAQVFEYDTQKAVERFDRFLKVEMAFEKKKFGVQDLTELVSQGVLNYVLEIEPVAVIVIHGGFINTSTIRSINKLGVLTHLFLTDDPQQIDVSSIYSQHYKSVSTNEKNCIEIHKGGSKNEICYLPTGYDVGLHKKVKPLEDRDVDILVAGSFYEERLKFVRDIKDVLMKYNTKIVGRADWQMRAKYWDKQLRSMHDNNRYPLETILDLKRRAKIVLDYPRDETRSMYGYSNQREIKATGLAPRVYEVPCCGAVLLTGCWRDCIYDTFPTEILPPMYRGAEDCVEQIETILKDVDSYKEKIEKQRKHIFKNHTYNSRVEKLLDVIQEHGTIRAPNQTLYELSKGNMNLLRSSFDNINDKTVEKFGETWDNNFDENKLHIEKTNDVSKFTGTRSGKTCILASNGPSLEFTLDKIKKHLNGTIDVFTVNGAVNVFAKKKIKQDFTVIIHPTDDQVKHFNKVKQLNHPLLIAAQCSPKVAESWKKKGGEVYYFHAYMPGCPGNMRHIDEKQLTIVGSNMSVAFSATEIAMGMGYKKIIFVGFDFSYVNGKKYYGEPVKFEDVIPRGAVLKKDCFTGQPVITDEVMLTSKDVMSMIFDNFNIQFVNASGAGLLDHRNVRKMDIVDALKEG